MGTQLDLPAGWARNLPVFRHPADRLDALVQDRLDAKAEIRAILDRLAERYGAPPADVTHAMGWVDDGLGDLLYDIEQGFRHEIEGENPV
jgi:glutathione S-transferase